MSNPVSALDGATYEGFALVEELERGAVHGLGGEGVGKGARHDGLVAAEEGADLGHAPVRGNQRREGWL